jgi:hypothetical protein
LSINKLSASIEPLLIEVNSTDVRRRVLQILLIAAVTFSATGAYSICLSEMISMSGTCCCASKVESQTAISENVRHTTSFDCIPACCSSEPQEKGAPIAERVSTQRLNILPSEDTAPAAYHVISSHVPDRVYSSDRQGSAPPHFILCHSLLI